MTDNILLCVDIRQLQWPRQPKTWRGGKWCDFERATVSCLGHCLSKHKMARYARNVWGMTPLVARGYAYVTLPLVIKPKVERRKGSSAMEILAASSCAKLRRSNRSDKEMNLQCNYFESLLLNDTFVRRTTDLEKTANMNWLPFSLWVTTCADALLFKGYVWAHDQLFALWRNTRKERDFTREQPMHPPKAPPNLIL